MTLEHSTPQNARPGATSTSEPRQGGSAHTDTKSDERSSSNTSSEGHHTLHDGVQKIKEGGHKIKEGGRESLEATRELGQEMWFEGREKAKGAIAQLEDYVSENPVRSVLWAAGIGAVLGMLQGRRG